jgi:tetratricopeptide (TPR) repeat protein
MSKYSSTIEPPLPLGSGNAQPLVPPLGWGLLVIGLGIMVGRQLARPTQPTGADRGQALQWLGRGKELEKAKRFEAAIALYDEALQYHPQEFRLWHERGLALAKLQRFEEAISSYDRAYAINPNQRDLAHERGDALLQLERFEEAIVSLDRYLRYQPDSAHVLGDRAFALYRLGKYEAALLIWERILKTERNDLVSLKYAHYHQIQTLKQLGRWEQAQESMQTALRRYPDEAFKALHDELQKATS